MGARVINQTFLENFIIQLEFLALQKEDNIINLEKINKDYKYIKNLLEVLSSSKVAFAEGYFSLRKEEQDEFTTIISRIITYPKNLSEIIKETKNLYFLYKNNLYNNPAVKSQRKISENVLANFIQELKEFINRVDYQKNEEEIKKLQEYIENIILLANNFEEFGGTRNVAFFEQVIEEIDLSNLEKREIINAALIGNVEQYKKEDKKEEQLEDYVINSSKDSNKGTSVVEAKDEIEELLEEMLNEESATNMQSKKKSK